MFIEGEPLPNATTIQPKKSKYKLRKRKRSSTSVEGLSSDTEAVYERDERRALEDAEAKDDEYSEGNSGPRESVTIPVLGRRTSRRMAGKRAKRSPS
jgi:hypothetical protein